MTDWDQLEADTGWELYYFEAALVDGAINLGDLADEIELCEDNGWELIAIGHSQGTTLGTTPAADGNTQLCFRRAYPDRDQRLATLHRLRDEIEARARR